MTDYHEPALCEKVLHYLNAAARKEGVIVDGTLGDGGHAELILRNAGPGCRVLGIDRDASALERARKRLAPFGGRVGFVHGNFSDIKGILRREGIVKISGLLLDLGVSSRQIDNPERGFSFMRQGPLDMRMNVDDKTTAAGLLETLSDTELEFVFKTFGEERFSRRIVRAIRKAQAKGPVTETLQLSQILVNAVSAPRHAKIHPATRSFQALRIAVNDELESLKTGLRDSLDVLEEGGRLVAISFHSLEDRIVKQFFRTEEKGCVCPPRLPVCVCGRKRTVRVLTPKPATPSRKEVQDNPRASSAKLRACERVYV
ncbi:MAG: 16S rRNA (cytosine(1402)-N(4))-methyltransferase RsmH [Nitrospinae bacterium]|nr:16S rRNA (cytosine(1402)-N(4))-methyltransferase RsmH [Nitrospinota bacterium]